jgi:hypothetical protein
VPGGRGGGERLRSLVNPRGRGGELPSLIREFLQVASTNHFAFVVLQDVVVLSL